MPRVYIETTIPSFYFETRESVLTAAWRELTRRWWDNERRKYVLYTSSFVVGELSRGRSRKTESAIRLLEGIPLLEHNAEVRSATEFYLTHKLMPADAFGDAAHLAMASVHGIDYLLTWNCRHLANSNKVVHIRTLNERLGLRVPLVVTPLTLLGDSLLGTPPPQTD